MNRTITAYRNVFKREDAKTFDFIDLVKNQYLIFNAFKLDDYESETARVKSLLDKTERNEAKRDYFPAVDLSASGVLSIDIDGISNNERVKNGVVTKLSSLDTCLAVMESVSGNVVAFFKYECATVEYPFLYYKLYLELTLTLSVNIDFLPEIGRLRYVSTGELYHFNEEAHTLTELMQCESLPYINTQVGKDKARTAIYGSR
jgi:hypothetical protein